MTKDELKEKLIDYKDGGNSIDGILSEIDHYIKTSLPNKGLIIAESKTVYDALNNSGDLEAVRQAKTCQLMFIAGGYFGRGLNKQGL